MNKARSSVNKVGKCAECYRGATREGLCRYHLGAKRGNAARAANARGRATAAAVLARETGIGAPASKCSVIGCTKPPRVKGLCRGHYDRTRRAACAYPGCAQPVRASGLCAGHHEQTVDAFAAHGRGKDRAVAPSNPGGAGSAPVVKEFTVAWHDAAPVISVSPFMSANGLIAALDSEIARLDSHLTALRQVRAAYERTT